MSKSITEKELAEKLADAYDDSAHGFRCVEDEADFLRVARTAAELLGVTLTPEKPEPGVYLTDSEHIGFVDYDGDFHLLNLTGRNYRESILHRDMGAYSAVPARVVPEAEYQRLIMEADLATEKAPTEPVELSASDVCAIHNEHGHGRYFEDFSIEDRNGVLATVNAARRNLLEASK